MDGKGIFIAGTGTNVGKTVVTGLLARSLSGDHEKVITQKWIQTGSEGAPIDVEKHLEIMGATKDNYKDTWGEINPYIFKYPASPHLAARLEEREIDSRRLINATSCLMQRYEYVLVEGSGGLMVPVNEEKVILSIIEDMQLPVLIVADNRLGAINHTLLTIDALKIKKIKVVGVVFNQVNDGEDSGILADNPDIVMKLSGVKVFGSLKLNSNIDSLYEEFVPIGQKIIEETGYIYEELQSRRKGPGI